MSALEVYLWAWVLIGGCMTLLWLASIPLRNVSIVDMFWGMGFVIVGAWAFMTGQGDPGRKWLLLFLVGIWGLRLSGYLAWRNWGKPEDFRYQKFRQDYGPQRYWWFSFFQVFLLQGVLMGVIVLPVVFAHAAGEGRPIGAWDVAGALVWLIGFFFESVGDWQMARFKGNPANKGKVMDRGLWRFTRHPNYFGDSAVWWGYGLIAVGAGVWWAAIGSVIMTALIIKVSGVALLEKSLGSTKPGYADYVRRTRAFFPWPPKRL